MSELDVGDIIKQALLDFLKRIGRERVERIPLGVGSGLHKEGARGLFVYLRGKERQFWCYYDLTKERDPITERKLEILRMIHCDEKTKRVEPDFDVYPIIDRCKRYITNRLKRHVVKPPTLKAPQNQIVNWLQAYSAQTSSKDVGDLLAYFSQPLPGVLLTHLRKLWRQHRNGLPTALLSELQDFMQGNPVVASDTPTDTESVGEEELQLVCWLALV